MLKLALYQPEIASNLGACIRTAACFGAELHVIEPCGFPWKDRDITRVAMDYETKLVRHRDWASFRDAESGRLILMTTKTEDPLETVILGEGDVLLMGQESAGVPDWLHREADERVTIPLTPGARSLNVSVAAAIGLAEWARQLRQG